MRDGVNHGAAIWNPEGDMGDMEIWELAEPLLYLGRNVKLCHPQRLEPSKSKVHDASGLISIVDGACMIVLILAYGWTRLTSG